MFNKGAINIKILMLVLLIAIVIYIIGCEGGPFDSGVDELDDDPGESTPIERGDIIETDHVIINGITFYFDDTYNVGTYTNGDYWVLGPVTLKRITPDYYIDETYQPPRHKNGWEVNPRVRVGAEKQGFDSKLPGYSSEKMPELPITITEHNSSIVKVISLDCEDPCYPALDFAAVLTVVTEIPPVNQFRPTYTGSPDDKIIRTLDDVAFDLLPSIIDKNIPHPDFENAIQRQKTLKFEHIAGNQMKSRPRQNLKDYLPYATGEVGNYILLTMTNEDQTKRYELLTHILQHGLDWIALLDQGYYFPRGGGEQAGGILVPTYTTAMFDDDIFADIINEATDIAKDFPYAEYSLQISDIGMPLYGNALGPDRYWAYFHGGYGSLTAADPHRYIDGQQKPGTSYQVCCSTGFWKHMVIIFTLFPEMKDVWYYQPMETYVQRWVLHGVWTLPDPCAPYDGNLENYEKTYGPDTDNPGDCIKGTIGCIGRYPELHGTNADGAACSGYASALWDDYYVPRADTPPFAAIISPIEDRTVSGDVLLKATAYSVHGLESVEFLVDGETISPVVTAPLSDSPTTYSVPWNTTQLPDGIYSLTVEATGRDGRRYESVAVEVQVDNQ